MEQFIVLLYTISDKPFAKKKSQKKTLPIFFFLQKLYLGSMANAF